jgi:hypothetical protein
MENKLQLPLGWKIFNWFETNHKGRPQPKKVGVTYLLSIDGTILKKTDYCVHAHLEKPTHKWTCDLIGCLGYKEINNLHIE